MKQAIFTITLLFTSIGFTRPLNSEDQALKVRDLIQPAVLQIEGVNGIGITGCNPKTGKQDVMNDFVHCVVVYAETDEGFEQVSKLYPQGTKIKGVWIVIDQIGTIVPQPRMSVGG